MLVLFSLFYEFFKIGLFAIGGGLATMPFLYDMSEKTGWFTKSELTNMIAISESTPGPLGVNMATYVGFSTSGILGGIIATLGLITPAIIIIIIVSNFLNKFKDNPYVESVFRTMRPTSTGLIVGAGWGVFAITMFNLDKFNDNVAATMACKMSIKANTAITNEEMENLISDLRKCKNPFNCPHGRPTVIYYSKNDLEKYLGKDKYTFDLAGVKPDYSNEGKAVRFDCFVQPKDRLEAFKKKIASME